MKRGGARRTGKSHAARLRPFWPLIVLLCAAVAAAASWASSWPGFWPKRVTVGGNRVVPTSDILSRAAIDPRANIWLQNTHAAADRVTQIPYVGTVTIRRSLPASIRIEITERRPFAKVRFGDGAAIVDRDLRVLQRDPGYVDLPVLKLRTMPEPPAGTFLRAANATRLRNDYVALSDHHVAVSVLEYDKYSDLLAATRAGVALLLGDDADLAQKAAMIEPILSQAAARGRTIAMLDLRAPRTPVVRYAR